MVGEGGTVICKKGYGWIEDELGERIRLTEKDGMYMVKLWEKKGSFKGQ